jgi:hypothetical protein
LFLFISNSLDQLIEMRVTSNSKIMLMFGFHATYFSRVGLLDVLTLFSNYYSLLVAYLLIYVRLFSIIGPYF